MAGAAALGQAIGSRPNLHDLTIKLISKQQKLRVIAFKLALGQAIGSRPNLHDLTIKLISKQQKLRVMAVLMCGIAQSQSI
jgi:hypothetical protein